MKLLWLGYLVYSLGNCVMKLCIETGLIVSSYLFAPMTNISINYK